MAFLHVILFSSEHQQPHVLMSNPCDAVHQPLRRIILSSTEEMIQLQNPETGYEKAHRQVEQIFRRFFPARGMVTREGQIQLCHTMLDALFGRDVALCDAGVGLGKTYAYLVACVLWQLQRPQQMQRPVVISTASIALQSAILKEYIPFLSDVLIQNGYIQKPICAVLRKGKERFACDKRLLIRQKQISVRGERFRRRATALRAANQCLDLDLLPGISRHDRRLICVPERCSRSCILHSDCRYRQYLKDSNDASVTIQVCNHNYLLADAAHRQNGWKPLLKDYQALIIDEAHKLPETVRQMNTRRIRSSDLLHFEKILVTSHCTLGAQKLRGASRAFLTAFTPAENESERAKSLCLTTEQSAALQHLNRVIEEILKLENKETPLVLRNKLHDIQELLPLFLRRDTTFVRYVECRRENGILSTDLCAVPFDLPQCVYDALWREQKPAILTSGTLDTGEDFTHAKHRLGLDRGTPLRTLRILSPFRYDENCLLYFPEPQHTKPPYKQDEDRVAHQIQELINTANGHTLVLFTSYDQMGRVYEKLKNKFPVPVLQVQRNPQVYLERFKQLPNAVLFASGACWEDVNFPGDMVSLLIIVKLPFKVPDPLGEALRKQYRNLHSYIQAEVVPEMQIKLRQGFGRAIRTESDSCVVAVLDPRAAPGKRYRQAVLDALPKMPISDKLTDIQSFLQSKKNPSYFEPRFLKEVDYHAGNLFHSGSQKQRSHHAAADSDLP